MTDKTWRGTLDELMALPMPEPEQDPNQCKHPKTIPAFDREASHGLSTEAVRKRWPRFYGKCPDCGASVIGYASYEHYFAGDW